MPTPVTPGVYLAELGVGPPPIEALATDIAAFVGPSCTGPVAVATGGTAAPAWLTGMADYERVYGGAAELAFDAATPCTNYLAHAVRAYFAEGGRRLGVARVVGSGAACASTLLRAGPKAARVGILARFPGAAGNGQVAVREDLHPASLADLDAAPAGSLLCCGPATAEVQYVKLARKWRPALDTRGAAASVQMLAAADPRLVTLSLTACAAVSVAASAAVSTPSTVEGLGFDKRHPSWVGRVLSIQASIQASAQPSMQASMQASEPLLPFALETGSRVSAAQLHAALFAGGHEIAGPPQERIPECAARRLPDERIWLLSGGSDGALPTAADYLPALQAVAGWPGVSTVAAPGSSALPATDAHAVATALVAHAAAPGAWRVAVLDTPPQSTPAQAAACAAQWASSHAALYYPWVLVDGGSGTPLALPPSGFVAGLYAMNDAERGVHKAPANMPVASALGLERDIGQAEQDTLNPAGVNCLRLLPGRGHRVWGARLTSTDPQWRVLPQRRYANYLEACITRGTRWAAFEPNAEPLWARMQTSVAEFLQREWRSGALLGNKPEEAFFVHCGRDTMTPADISAGRLLCLLGMAPIRPAEFVLLRLELQALGPSP